MTRNMIPKTLAIVCLYSLIACGQHKEKAVSNKVEAQKSKTMNTTAQAEIDLLKVPVDSITADNIVEVIANQVQRYEVEPIYYLRIGKANCLIEVLVNDIPTYKNYTLSNLATPLEINDNILKSGTQTITVRMYPVGDLIKEEYDYGDTVTTLGDASAVQITIIQADHKGNQGMDDEETVIAHHSPTKDEAGEVFTGSGLPFYEYTFSFEATVPYHIKNGWDTAIDLTKLDQDYVEQQAVTYYNNFLQQFKKGNADAIAKLNYTGMLIQAQTYYNTKKEIQEVWDEDIELFTNPTREVYPFDSGYKVLQCASGRGVYLRHKNPEDPQLLHKSMAWLYYEKNGTGRGNFFNNYLYCPKKAYNRKKLVFRNM
ncbi:hypothetical protein [Aquimarina aquimarini]|uniref:hypothetical protein n=1 Tax=Aquimarina aquimarini TaxID=1191734 RepID=UPI000D55C853|nr:hypothetical protein [Aquimarina aquimarini]